jgi:hypothetical protein
MYRAHQTKVAEPGTVVLTNLQPHGAIDVRPLGSSPQICAVANWLTDRTTAYVAGGCTVGAFFAKPKRAVEAADPNSKLGSTRHRSNRNQMAHEH